MNRNRSRCANMCSFIRTGVVDMYSQYRQWYGIDDLGLGGASSRTAPEIGVTPLASERSIFARVCLCVDLWALGTTFTPDSF